MRFPTMALLAGFVVTPVAAPLSAPGAESVAVVDAPATANPATPPPAVPSGAPAIAEPRSKVVPRMTRDEILKLKEEAKAAGKAPTSGATPCLGPLDWIACAGGVHGDFPPYLPRKRGGGIGPPDLQH